MRYFLGFDLDPKLKIAIDEWRTKALPNFERQVPAKNFHVTSVFLGHVSESALERMLLAIDKLHFSEFSMSLNALGYFAKPKVLWIGPKEKSQEAAKICQGLTETARQSGVELSNTPYIPHVTLVRKAQSNPPSALFGPDFTAHFKQLHLFESVSASSGVSYPIRKSWRLV